MDTVHEDSTKKQRKFSPTQAGKAILNQIRNKGLTTEEKQDTSDTDSDSNGSVLEDTENQEKSATGDEPANDAASMNN